MKDPVGSCAYNLLYQDLKRFSKNGEHFCKELMSVFQQRSELEINYAKGLQKLAGKLIKASKGMTSNSTYHAWSHVSDEMYSTADIHRTLGNAFHQEAILEIRQVLEEHNKRKRPLDNIIEKTGKLVTTNWNEQLKVKKKLNGLTREHEALFSFVENNRQICTEKEKQKLLNRLTKSAELQARIDEEYFAINMDGHQVRLKWENTLKNCYQIIQELEKQRIETLSTLLNKYSLHMSSFGQTLVHCQKKIDQAIKKMDVEKDIQTLVEETSVTAEDNKAEFLMADYFEEDSKTVMGRERRIGAMKTKLKRLEGCITKTKNDHDGLEKMVPTYTENPSFSNRRNLEETEQLLDEATLKLDLLEATHCKLSTTMDELEGKPKSLHRFSDSITKWKDKDCEHSTVQLSRPIKIKKTAFRSRQSLRSSIIYKGPAKKATPQDSAPSAEEASVVPSNVTQEDNAPPHSDKLNGGLPKSDDEDGEANLGQNQKALWSPMTGVVHLCSVWIPVRKAEVHNSSSRTKDFFLGAELCSVGKCKALYDFTSGRDDELNIKEGDLLDIFQKDDNGWWYGELNGQRGHFPKTYVEEMPMLSVAKSSDA